MYSNLARITLLPVIIVRLYVSLRKYYRLKKKKRSPVPPPTQLHVETASFREGIGNFQFLYVFITAHSYGIGKSYIPNGSIGLIGSVFIRLTILSFRSACACRVVGFEKKKYHKFYVLQSSAKRLLARRLRLTVVRLLDLHRLNTVRVPVTRISFSADRYHCLRPCSYDMNKFHKIKCLIDLSTRR